MVEYYVSYLSTPLSVHYTPMSHTPPIVDHARATVMTFTSPPSLPLSRPWAGVSARRPVRSPLSA